MGATLALGVLSRETTVVLVVPFVVAAAVLVRRRRLGPGAVGRALGPPLVALAALSGVVWHATGRLVGSEAFLDRYDPGLVPPGPWEAVRLLGQRGLFPFANRSWGAASVWLGVVVVVLVVVGLLLAWRLGLRVEVATVVAMLAVQGAVLAQSVTGSLAPVTGRLLLPAYPTLVAVAAVGWAARRGAAVRWTMVASGTILAVWFLVSDLGPAYEWGVG